MGKSRTALICDEGTRLLIIRLFQEEPDAIQMEMNKAKLVYRRVFNNYPAYDDNDKSRQKLVIQWRKLVSMGSETQTDRQARIDVWNQVLDIPIKSFKDLSDRDAAAVAQVMADTEAMKEIKHAYYVLASQYAYAAADH